MQDPDERRSESRSKSVYRPALIETNGFSGFCMIRDLSTNGMMAEVYAAFQVGQPIEVELKQGAKASGTIIWSNDNRIGVEFDEEIDIDSILLGKDEGEVETATRAPRLHLQIEATLISGGKEIPAKVLDVSQRGVKVAASGVTVGNEVAIKLPNLPARKTIVKWTQYGVSGLSFVTPIAYKDLAEWVLEVQAVHRDENS